jgi:hypothetical protein
MEAPHNEKEMGAPDASTHQRGEIRGGAARHVVALADKMQ